MVGYFKPAVRALLKKLDGVDVREQAFLENEGMLGRARRKRCRKKASMPGGESSMRIAWKGVSRAARILNAGEA